MDKSQTIVPQWYLDAKAAGDHETVLKEKLRQFCIEAMLRRAGNDQAAAEAAVDDELVSITFNMYEHAIAKGEQ